MKGGRQSIAAKNHHRNIIHDEKSTFTGTVLIYLAETYGCITGSRMLILK